MFKIYDKKVIEQYIFASKYADTLTGLIDNAFITQYKKGEFITSPLQTEELFQIIVKGALSIYFVRDDGSVYSLSNGQTDYLLGDMELFHERNSSVYAEATEDSVCISISLNQYKEQLLQNNCFLRLICQSLSMKMKSITAIDAAPSTLHERVLTYMKYKCACGELKGLEKAAFHLNCSSRQLQRIMNQMISEGRVEKISKGTYRLISD